MRNLISRYFDISIHETNLSISCHLVNENAKKEKKGYYLWTCKTQKIEIYFVFTRKFGL